MATRKKVTGYYDHLVSCNAMLVSVNFVFKFRFKLTPSLSNLLWQIKWYYFNKVNLMAPAQATSFFFLDLHDFYSVFLYKFNNSIITFFDEFRVIKKLKFTLCVFSFFMNLLEKQFKDFLWNVGPSSSGHFYCLSLSSFSSSNADFL